RSGYPQALHLGGRSFERAGGHPAHAARGSHAARGHARGGRRAPANPAGGAREDDLRDHRQRPRVRVPARPSRALRARDPGTRGSRDTAHEARDAPPHLVQRDRADGEGSRGAAAVQGHAARHFAPDPAAGRGGRGEEQGLVKLAIRQLDASLKKGLAPLYAIHGAEALLALEAADRIRDAARKAGATEREIFFAEPGVDWSKLSASASNLSLFAS